MLSAALRSASVFALVQPWERGLRTRAGKRARVLAPGLHMKIPVIDRIEVQAVRPRAQFIGEQTLTTRDGFAVVVSSAVQYRVDDIRLLYDALHNAHDTLEQEAAAALADFIAGEARAAFDKKACERAVLARLAGDWPRYGIAALRFSIIDFTHPRALRVITGAVGRATGYDQRLEVGERSGAA